VPRGRRKMPVDRSPPRGDPPGAGEISSEVITPVASAQSASGKSTKTENPRILTPEIQASQLKDIKISAFWRARPRLWFVSLESEFAAYKVRTDEAMYRVTVRHLDEQAMLAVADGGVLEQPPTTGKYETLKNALIERFSDSIEKQMRTLLGEMELGEKKPSVLLREMRTLADTNISDSLLRTLWLQRLPARIQEILVVLESVGLDKLAICADKATECAGAAAVVAAVNTDPDNELQQLKHQISELTQAVAKISRMRNRSRSKERMRPQRRGRSKSTERQKTCYHRRFGEKAWQCLQPCDSVHPLAQREN